MAAMTKQELADLVSQLVRDCETYRDALSVDRIRAMEYYDGVMKDVPSDSNRSKVVSRDVRAAVKKVLPSLIRTVLGNDKVVEYEPVNQGDEAGAEQATDYINYIVFPESDGYDAVQDAAHDALKLRNGVIRWWYEKKQTVEVSSHTGLDEAALVQLIADDAVEVLEQSQSVEAIELPTGRVEQPVFNVKIRRTGERGSTRLAAVPLEEFLIHPDAISIDDSPITGINLRMRRSDLIAMGYDREKVEGFTVAGDHAQRNQPINEISSLLSGAQVSSPNFVPTQGQRIEPVNYAGLVQQDYQNRVAAYNQKREGISSVLGSILGALPKPSDRRLKKDIKKVGKLDGHSLYEYRYKGEPQRGAKHIGVMAQEVEKIRPDVVTRDPDGMRRVDYGRLFSAGRKKR